MRNRDAVFLHNKEFEPFLNEHEIAAAVSRIGDRISKDYQGKEVILLGVLDGALMVLSDLCRVLDLNIRIELIKLKSYTGRQSSGQIRELIGLTNGLAGKDVVIVEDIIDTGHTLEYLLKQVDEQNPASVRIASLLLKEEIFRDRFPVHYHGITIPNRFVVGYGMDYEGLGRQLKQIYALKETEHK